MNDSLVIPGDAALARAAMRDAQPAWAQAAIKDRVKVIAAARRLLAAESRAWAATGARPNMGEADILAAEVLPVLSACRFLETQAPKLLGPRPPPGLRPMWLSGMRATIRRVPFGCVLILAPRNYPLLLPGVQACQALAAGNGVLVKPAPGWADPMLFLQTILQRAGLPDGLFAVLQDTDAAGAEALRAGADKVVFTGGLENGRRVLAQLAENVTPATMELSGHDAMIVLPGADIATVARAIGYGLTMNGGETCIAPRRIIAAGGTAASLEAALAALLPRLPQRTINPREVAALRRAIDAAVVAGGRVLGDPSGLDEGRSRPLVLAIDQTHPGTAPIFGPIAWLHVSQDPGTAVTAANDGEFALGASVFGPAAAARAVAAQLRAGSVTVNDLIVSTADPRMPFGGAGASGFGVTRGADGLLEMTRPQSVFTRRKPMATQYRQLPDRAAAWIARGLRLFYGR